MPYLQLLRKSFFYSPFSGLQFSATFLNPRGIEPATSSRFIGKNICKKSLCQIIENLTQTFIDLNKIKWYNFYVITLIGDFV